MKTNTLICGDDLYHMDKAYREGALAMRNNIPWATGNPYRDGSQQHDQWSYGHVNESDDQHLRDGVDVITAPQSGQCFGRDACSPAL